MLHGGTFISIVGVLRYALSIPSLIEELAHKLGPCCESHTGKQEIGFFFQRYSVLRNLTYSAATRPRSPRSGGLLEARPIHVDHYPGLLLALTRSPPSRWERQLHMWPSSLIAWSTFTDGLSRSFYTSCTRNAATHPSVFGIWHVPLQAVRPLSCWLLALGSWLHMYSVLRNHTANYRRRSRCQVSCGLLELPRGSALLYS